MARKKFTADSGLGFMRFIQVINVLYILLLIVSMLFVRGSTIPLDYAAFLAVFEILCMAVAVWLIANRKIYTRQIVIVLMIAVWALQQVSLIIAGAFTFVGAFASFLGPLPLILYFAFSRRAKAVLVRPFDIKLNNESMQKNAQLWQPRKKEFWMRLLIYFFAFSVMGHWMEMGLQFFIVNGWFPGTVAPPDSLTWRDSLNPFFIYGIAVAFCGLALYPLYLKLRDKLPHIWQAMLISFLVNTLFCTVAELALGLAFNADLSAWDYSDQFLNFQGQICLLYTTAFGILSSAITWVLYPFMERRFARLSRDMMRVVFVASAVLFILIVATYNVDPNLVFGQSIDYKELTNTSA